MDPLHASGNSDGAHQRDYKDFHHYIDGVVTSSEDRDLEQQSVRN